MAVPSRTVNVIGASTLMGAEVRLFDPDSHYPLTGSDLNDLAALVVRFNFGFDDPNETRDWQNRLSVMISNAQDAGEV